MCIYVLMVQNYAVSDNQAKMKQYKICLKRYNNKIFSLSL